MIMNTRKNAPLTKLIAIILAQVFCFTTLCYGMDVTFSRNTHLRAKMMKSSYLANNTRLEKGLRVFDEQKKGAIASVDQVQRDKKFIHYMLTDVLADKPRQKKIIKASGLSLHSKARALRIVTYFDKWDEPLLLRVMELFILHQHLPNHADNFRTVLTEIITMLEAITVNRPDYARFNQEDLKGIVKNLRIDQYDTLREAIVLLHWGLESEQQLQGEIRFLSQGDINFVERAPFSFKPYNHELVQGAMNSFWIAIGDDRATLSVNQDLGQTPLVSNQALTDGKTTQKRPLQIIEGLRAKGMEVVFKQGLTPETVDYKYLQEMEALSELLPEDHLPEKITIQKNSILGTSGSVRPFLGHFRPYKSFVESEDRRIKIYLDNLNKKLNFRETFLHEIGHTQKDQEAFSLQTGWQKALKKLKSLSVSYQIFYIFFGIQFYLRLLANFSNLVQLRELYLVLNAFSILFMVPSLISGFVMLFKAIEIVDMKGVGQSSGHFISEYALTNNMEDFAETYWFYVARGEQFWQKAKNNKMLMTKYAFMRDTVFKGIEYGQDQGGKLMRLDEFRTSSSGESVADAATPTLSSNKVVTKTADEIKALFAKTRPQIFEENGQIGADAFEQHEKSRAQKWGMTYEGIHKDSIIDFISTQWSRLSRLLKYGLYKRVVSEAQDFIFAHHTPYFEIRQHDEQITVKIHVTGRSMVFAPLLISFISAFFLPAFYRIISLAYAVSFHLTMRHSYPPEQRVEVVKHEIAHFRNVNHAVQLERQGVLTIPFQMAYAILPQEEGVKTKYNKKTNINETVLTEAELKRIDDGIAESLSKKIDWQVNGQGIDTELAAALFALEGIWVPYKKEFSDDVTKVFFRLSKRGFNTVPFSGDYAEGNPEKVLAEITRLRKRKQAVIIARSEKQKKALEEKIGDKAIILHLDPDSEAFRQWKQLYNNAPDICVDFRGMSVAELIENAAFIKELAKLQ